MGRRPVLFAAGVRGNGLPVSRGYALSGREIGELVLQFALAEYSVSRLQMPYITQILLPKRSNLGQSYGQEHYGAFMRACFKDSVAGLAKGRWKGRGSILLAYFA